jgi:hypothetical protein
LNIDELIELRGTPQNPDEMLELFHEILSLEDLDERDRGAFSCGFLMGASWALGMGATGRATECGQKLIQLEGELSAHGVFGE